jgi:phosphoglycerol transferase MdoB-like AlkP superfamily enzyme
MLTPSTRYLVRVLLAPILIFILMRIGFWWAFRSGFEISNREFWTAWFLGIRYDIRVVLVLALPNILLMNFRSFNPRWSKTARKVWKAYWVFVMTLAFSFYLFDFGYYDYLRTHTNATALRFLVDLSISMRMIWESYPVVKAGLIILIFAWIYNGIFARFVLPSVDKSIENISFSQSFLNGFIATILVVIGLYGKFSQYPLRWSDAYFSNNAFTTALAVNPIHYFFDTLKYRKTEFDVEKTKKYIGAVRAYLGLPEDSAPLDLKREVKATPREKPVNVVVIVLESQAAFKTGIFGNVADPTPNLDRIAKAGTLFKKHYVPSEGTARSIFAILTAIPDVNTDYTSSRNPLIAGQNLILNAFTESKKFYFLGGSTSWGNIRGLISYNIPDIEIVEEGSFSSSSRNDVWGISDLDLFKEAHKRFNEMGDKPFFAVIQTAGFHRPYTIPTNHDDFKAVHPTETQIKDGGFDSAAELNSLRFQDFSLGKFFELAEKSEYFKNTIFVIQGDHGLPDNKAKNLSAGEIFLGTSRWHVPLVFYSPLLKEPKTVEAISSELDVMTSVAALAGKPHINTTLGRNLFDPALPPNRFALLYTYYESPPGISLIDDKYFVRCTARLNCQGLFDYTSETPEQDLKLTDPERYQKMQDLTFGLYESAKYLLYNNPNPLVKK